MLLSLIVLFIVCLLVFFAIAFFLPEWLGITGKKAQEIMKHQQGDPVKGNPAPAPEKEKTHPE